MPNSETKPLQSERGAGDGKIDTTKGTMLHCGHRALASPDAIRGGMALYWCIACRGYRWAK